MKLRSQCDCQCHNGTTILHLEPCCVPDLTLSLGWEKLEEQFKDRGLWPVLDLLKFSFYSGGATMLAFMHLISGVKDEELVQLLINKLNEEAINVLKDLMKDG